MSQSLLISNARTLDDLSQSIEDLAGDADGLKEVGLAGRVNDLFARVVPVKVHHGLLKPQQVINCANNQVHCCGVSCLGSQIILPI